MVNGFVNVVISNIERRYDLTSTETGTIASCYDIASVLCLIPVSYFGGLGCKPRYLGEELTLPTPRSNTHPYIKNDQRYLDFLVTLEASAASPDI